MPVESVTAPNLHRKWHTSWCLRTHVRQYTSLGDTQRIMPFPAQITGLMVCISWSWLAHVRQYASFAKTQRTTHHSNKIILEMAYFLVSSHSRTSVRIAWRHTANYAISCANYRPEKTNFCCKLHYNIFWKFCQR